MPNIHLSVYLLVKKLKKNYKQCDSLSWFLLEVDEQGLF